MPISVVRSLPEFLGHAGRNVDAPEALPTSITSPNMQTEALLKVAWVLGGALFGAALGTMVAPDETQLRYQLALLFAITVWRRVSPRAKSSRLI